MCNIIFSIWVNLVPILTNVHLTHTIAPLTDQHVRILKGHISALVNLDGSPMCYRVVFKVSFFEMGQSESPILFEIPNEQHQVSGSQQGMYTNVTYDQEKTHSFGGADNCVDYDECTGGVSHLSLDDGAIMTLILN